MITRNLRFKRRRSATQLVHRMLQSEALESRVLLASDVTSAWQNPLNANDVDQNGIVSWQDALSIIRPLNHEGARQLPAKASGEPESGSVVRLPDANGDGFLTPSDALQVINVINGEGEGETAGYRLELTDTSGNVITTAQLGDTVQLHVYVQDLRDATEAEGLFSAYVDVEYDGTLISVPSDNGITFGDDFANGQFGVTSVSGVLDEVGGFVNSFSGAGTDEVLLFTVEMEASAAGSVTFRSNPADAVPARETLFFGSDEAIPAEDIDFGSVSLTVEAPVTGPVDLVAFASDLAAAGVEFWSTGSFSPDSVTQRALFEDGADLLPMRETLTSTGSLTSEALAAGITTVNTWVFPDQTESVGAILSLEEISQRSGVALPMSDAPTLKEIADVTLTDESPVHIALDGYDPDGGPLTYEVTSDNPQLLMASILQGNRSWLLDVDGYGNMVFEFFEQRASRATDQFIELTEDGFYDGITFHRIIDDFVIQGGDPTGTGAGSSDLPDFDDEFHVDLQHNLTGVLSMAKAGDDTNNSQFFITEGAQQHLDFNHTVFGQLTEGEAIRDAVSETPGSTTVTIRSASVFTDMENATLFLEAAGAGSGNVTVTVTDDQGLQASQTFAVNASNDTRNSQPFLSDIPGLTAAAGSTLEFQLEHTDIEGNDVFFFVDGVSSTDVVATVSDTGLVSVQVPASAGGSVISVDVAVSESTSVFSSNRDEQRVRITVEAGDAASDSFTVAEDSIDNALEVLANDGFGDNALITFVSTDSLPGNASISADGRSIIFTPNADFVGAATFSYTVEVGGAAFTGLVDVDVENVVDGPTAHDDSFPADFTDQEDIDLLVEDSSGVILAVLTNDRPDPDQEEIVLITEVTDPAFGTVEFNGFNITYVPNPDFVGEDFFTYTIEGLTSGLSSTGSVTVTVPELNDAPTASDDAFTLAADETHVLAAVDLLSNDSAGPGNESDQVLSITDISYQGAGTVTITADGDLEYTPAAGFTGTETIEYTVTDDGTDRGVSAPQSSTGSITVNVEAPVFAQPDDYAVDFASQDNVLDVLANDLSSADIVAASDPTHGTVTIAGDGQTLMYTPNVDFAGPDSFTYTARTASGEEATATVTIDVDSQTPTAVDDTFTVTSDQILDVLANDLWGTGNAGILVNQVTQPSGGVVSIVVGGTSVDYQPNDGFFGDDTFTYRVTDATGKTSTATVTVSVEVPMNDPPLAFNDDVIVLAGGGAQAIDVLANDTTLPDTGETLALEAIITEPQNGTAVINGDGTAIIYTPGDGFEGVDTLSYRVSDGNGGTATASVDITVEAVGNPPVAEDDALVVDQDGGEQSLDVLSNDTTLPDSGEQLTIVTLTAMPQHGTASISGDGTAILYTPDAGFAGADSLSYEVSDGNGGVDTANVTITVDAAIAAPVAVDDAFEVTTLGQQVYDLLGNDTGDVTSLRISALETTGVRGDLVISSDGTEIIYTPNFTEFGTETFTYTIEDGSGMTAEASVSINVPDLLGGSYFGGSIYMDLDRDGQRQSSERGLGGVTVVLEGTDMNGSAVRMQTKTDLDGDYRFERIAPGDYTVTEAQPAFVLDGQAMMGDEAIRHDTLSFSVSESLITADANTFAENGLVSRLAALNSLTSSRAPGLFAVLEGDQLAWVEARGGWETIAQLDLDVQGSELVLRGTDTSGTDMAARLSMTDRQEVIVLGRAGDHTFVRVPGGSDLLSVEAVDDVMGAPVAESDTYDVEENGTLSVDAAFGVLANDSDPDGDSLEASLILEPTNGSLALSDDGSFVYTPNADFAGVDTFRYRALAGDDESNVGVVTIDVQQDQVVNELFAAVSTGSFEDEALLGTRTDLVAGAPAISAEHVDGDIDYSAYSNPPTYGDHHGFDPNDQDVNPGVTPRPTGVYTTEQPDEDVLHNLEHGHVWISYDPSQLDAESVNALEQLVRDGSPQADGSGVGVILTPRAANDSPIALASWARLQTLDQYDPEAIRNFVETNRGHAPEGFITP